MSPPSIEFGRPNRGVTSTGQVNRFNGAASRTCLSNLNVVMGEYCVIGDPRMANRRSLLVSLVGESYLQQRQEYEKVH